MKEALKLALGGLKRAQTELRGITATQDISEAITAINEALAQPEQEPVAFDVQKALRRAYHLGQSYWADADSESYAANKRSDKHRQNFDELCEEALAYTTPPKREPLSDKQAKAIFRMARELEDTGRLCSLSETNSDRLDWRSKNQHVQVALQDYLKSLTYTQGIKE